MCLDIQRYLFLRPAFKAVHHGDHWVCDRPRSLPEDFLCGKDCEELPEHFAGRHSSSPAIAAMAHRIHVLIQADAHVKQCKLNRKSAIREEISRQLRVLRDDCKKLKWKIIEEPDFVEIEGEYEDNLKREIARCYPNKKRS